MERELLVLSLLERRIRAVSPFTDRRAMIGAGRLLVRLACRLAGWATNRRAPTRFMGRRLDFDRFFHLMFYSRMMRCWAHRICRCAKMSPRGSRDQPVGGSPAHRSPRHRPTSRKLASPPTADPPPAHPRRKFTALRHHLAAPARALISLAPVSEGSAPPPENPQGDLGDIRGVPACEHERFSTVPACFSLTLR
jgi:hypothetical protein